MALGALPGDVIRMVLWNGLALTLAGLAAGLLGFVLLSRLLTTLLYGITPRDTMSFAVAALMLALVALLACLIPASRAARIHPAVALRNE